jgi:hypothetical protein
LVLHTLSNTLDFVIVPTNKTNTHHPMHLTDYIADVHSHLAAHAMPVTPQDLQQIQKDGLAHWATHEALLSKKEHALILDCLNSHAVPTPHLLIKDHKPIDSTTG